MKYMKILSLKWTFRKNKYEISQLEKSYDPQSDLKIIALNERNLKIAEEIAKLEKILAN